MKEFPKQGGSENAVWCSTYGIYYGIRTRRPAVLIFFSAGTSGNHFGMGLFLSESILENIADVKGKAGYL